MVIFVQLIQRYLVCARESIILQFTPSFLFSFFNIVFWTKVIEITVFTLFAVFLPKILMIACYIL